MTKLTHMKPNGAVAEIKMFRDFDSRQTGADIEDPFYGGLEGFEVMMNQIEDCARGLVQAVQFHQIKPRNVA